VQDGIALPRRSRGYQSAKAQARYERDVKRFCDRFLQIQSRLDFKVSARGWCYILEEYGLRKDDFDAAEKVINDCRKSGDLPLDICSEDSKRVAENLEDIDPDPEEKAANIVNYVQMAEQWYTPFSFWDDLDIYVQMGVEKIDLKSLFSSVCSRFYVPLANIGGWGDLHVRAGFMQRFKEKEAEGKKCILLYCGDFDPGGLNISNFLRSNFNDMSRAVGWSPDGLIIDRFGLDYDFIEQEGLTWINNLITSNGKYSLDDERHSDHFKSYVQDYLREYGARKVEANSLVARPAAGRALCRQAIMRYVPVDAPRRYLKKLKPIRTQLRREIDRLLSA